MTADLEAGSGEHGSPLLAYETDHGQTWSTDVGTLHRAIRDAVQRWPQRGALRYKERTLTYADLDVAADRLAATYRAVGVQPGDRIVCQLANCPEHIIAMTAAWRCRAIHVGVDHQLTGRELSWLCVETGATVIAYQPPLHADEPYSALMSVLREHPSIRVLLHGDCVRSSSEATERGTWISFENDVATRSPAATDVGDDPNPDDPAVLFVTSGTTGKPKLCIGYHGALAAGWRWLSETARFAPDDVHLGQLPLSHGFGLSTAIMALMTGGTLTLMDRFGVDATLKTITAQGISVLNGTPSHFTMLADRFDPSMHDVHSLRIGFGTAATFPIPLLHRIFDELRMDLVLMYGSAEGLTVLTSDRDEMLMGSVGRPEPGFVTIVSPDRTPLPLGEAGEIAMRRGPWRVGYWSADAAPPPGGDDQWYFTGDLGRLDADGRLYVLGRVKHQINRGGMKVDPGEVETFLLRCPGIRDAAVTGAADAVLGETVRAWLVPEAETRPTLAEVRSVLASDLAPYKLPDEVRWLTAIPRTHLGKVDRTRLAALDAGDEVGGAGAHR